jgi:prepilin-type N-terminal cleavage/methylation domain-containing protein
MNATRAHTPSSRRNDQERQGMAFTLVELLVVLSIITVLSALVFSSLAKAKGLGRLTVCKSNLRQVGLGLMMYTQEYRAYPGIQEFNAEFIVFAHPGGS